MEANVTDVDEAIAEYRRRVQAEAKLAESDLDEIEEHLRELTDDLRTAGMPAAEAVTEAARRLGDPRQLAREHARVRSPFGAPLSAGRAWSAAILLVVPLVMAIVHIARTPGPPLPSRFWLDMGLFALSVGALAARRPWARAAVLGATASGVTHALALPLLVQLPADPRYFIWLIGDLGAFAFVMPWRRKEVSLPAITLALQASAYSAGGLSVVFTEETMAMLAVVSAAACIGTVLRARWSAIASAVSALTLFIMVGELCMWRSELSSELQLFVFVLANFGGGAIAATVAAILAWRTTRSTVGTLQHAVR